MTPRAAGRFAAGIAENSSASVRGRFHSRSSIFKYTQSSYRPSAPIRAGKTSLSVPSSSLTRYEDNDGGGEPQAGQLLAAFRMPAQFPHSTYPRHRLLQDESGAKSSNHIVSVPLVAESRAMSE